MTTRSVTKYSEALTPRLCKVIGLITEWARNRKHVICLTAIQLAGWSGQVINETNGHSEKTLKKDGGSSSNYNAQET